MNHWLTPLFAACGDYLQAGADAGVNPMTQARAPTIGSIIFEVNVLIEVAAACAVMARRVPRFWLKFVATAAGVLMFEFFTAPMWRNEKLGWWGYVYHDVSWILTLGWTALILGTITLVDTLSKQGAIVRFILVLLVLLPLVLIAENFVVAFGIRGYAPEVQARLSGYTIGLVPIEALYYVLVFTALVVAFSKYWSIVIDDPNQVPLRRTHWLRALGLTTLAVVLFEVMIEPVVDNRNLPTWSYYFHDLSILLTGLWIVIITIAGLAVHFFLGRRPLPQRFAAALLLITAIALPLESWFIHSGVRVYGPSATANFCGYNTWLTDVPVEVVFAIPMYMALVICFVRYFEIVAKSGAAHLVQAKNQPHFGIAAESRTAKPVTAENQP